ncbi:hypothetical protein F9Z35_1878 [Neisseria gonorrhoeae]|nr:hypothetical protein F9Z35_1878 [Neisseria gonorrhoeae]
MNTKLSDIKQTSNGRILSVWFADRVNKGWHAKYFIFYRTNHLLVCTAEEVAFRSEIRYSRQSAVRLIDGNQRRISPEATSSTVQNE